jgi:hypothetical protein
MFLLSLPQDVPTLGERLRNAISATPTLIAEIVREARRRFPSQAQPARTARVGQLIALGAWTDAALALIELELPQWQVRRLAYDDGEWHCALSRERELPDWLDASVEGRHADLALAILSALVEVRQLGADTQQSSVPRAPQRTGARYEPLLCDNFS